MTKKRKDAKLELMHNDYFEITKNRYKNLLEPYFDKNKNEEITLVNGKKIKISNFNEIKLAKKNKIGLKYDIIDENVSIKDWESTIQEEIEQMRIDITTELQNINNNKVSNFVGKLDILCNQSYLTIKNLQILFLHF